MLQEQSVTLYARITRNECRYYERVDRRNPQMGPGTVCKA